MEESARPAKGMTAILQRGGGEGGGERVGRCRVQALGGRGLD